MGFRFSFFLFSVFFVWLEGLWSMIPFRKLIGNNFHFVINFLMLPLFSPFLQHTFIHSIYSPSFHKILNKCDVKSTLVGRWWCFAKLGKYIAWKLYNLMTMINLKGLKIWKIFEDRKCERNNSENAICKQRS